MTLFVLEHDHISDNFCVYLKLSPGVKPLTGWKSVKWIHTRNIQRRGHSKTYEGFCLARKKYKLSPAFIILIISHAFTDRLPYTFPPPFSCILQGCFPGTSTSFVVAHSFNRVTRTLRTSFDYRCFPGGETREKLRISYFVADLVGCYFLCGMTY